MVNNSNKNDKNLFKLIDSLIIYEKEHGVKFDRNGFPIFKKEWYLDLYTPYIIPYTHRNIKCIANEKKIICFYEKDEFLYRKLTLNKLADICKELKKFKGFIGFDLSIFRDFLYPFQKFYILANLVISTFFILAGNKMIPNLRSDETNGRSYFYLFSKAHFVACGTLGCSRTKQRKKANIKEIDEYCEKHKNQTLIQYGCKLSNKENAVFIKAYGRRNNYNG